jgi:transglutaminase-like putative cysteine protease
MKFRVLHQTDYHYDQPASESFAELRIWPVDSICQKVAKRGLDLNPQVPVDDYIDYFGNRVEFFSIPFRHQHLSVKAWAEVETFPTQTPEAALHVPLAEARQIFNSQMLDLFEFLQPTTFVPLHKILQPLRKNFFKPTDNLRDSILHLNHWIFTHFKYEPGSTEIGTPLDQVVKQRSGVCQDFAHLMLAILRSYGIPARYVSGYIEAYDPDTKDKALTGAMASHAWVEAYLPGMYWWGLDPTNNQETGERHVKVAVGRDYADVAPLRGTYKGASNQKLEVIVTLKRRKTRAASPAPSAPLTYPS